MILNLPLFFPLFPSQRRESHGAVPQTARETTRFGCPPASRATLGATPFDKHGSSSFPLSCSDQRLPGDSGEVVRLVVQAVHFYERKLRDFYTHLRYSDAKRCVFIQVVENNSQITWSRHAL